LSTTNGRSNFTRAFAGVDEGLTVLHASVDRFRSTLGEIGSKVLIHGRPPGTAQAVAYSLRYDSGVVEASLVDFGAPADEHLRREMPEHERESGRGLAMARSLLDELGYERDGDLNRWRLVKRL
jgi:serine/threonine-protein kinase RsbW